MNEPLQFTFTPNKSDYIKTVRAFVIQQKSMRVMTILILLVVIIIVLAFVTTSQFSTYALIFLVFLIFFFGALVFLNPATLADKVEKDERLRCETTWLVDEDKVSIHNAFSDTNFDWPTFGEALETDEHYLLCYSTNRTMFQIIPKRAFTSAERQESFRYLVEQKLGKIRHVRSVNLPEPSRRTVMFSLYGVLGLFILFAILLGYIRAAGR